MVRNISGHGPSSAGSTGGPNRPKASPALKSLAKEVGQVSTDNISEQGIATARYVRLNRSRGLPKAHEEKAGAGKVRKTSEKCSKAADRVIY